MSPLQWLDCSSEWYKQKETGGAAVLGKWLCLWGRSGGLEVSAHDASWPTLLIGPEQERETTCWLQRLVEGTLWYSWVLPEKSGETLEKPGTELAFQLYSRPNSTFGRRGKYGVLGTRVGSEIGVTRKY